MRHTIGQSDLTPADQGEWSYDSNGGIPDPMLTHFNLTAPGERMVTWLRRMRERDGDIMLLGSPWSPPQWMKNTSTNKINVVAYGDAWARYIVAYIDAFSRLGVKIYALTPQNEPLHSDDPAWTTEVSAADGNFLLLLLSFLTV